METGEKELLSPKGYVTVRILDVPYCADKPYIYYCDAEDAADIRPGSLVVVPFGGGNRQTYGVITDFPDPEKAALPARCKPVKRLVSEEFRLNAELRGLCAFLSETTFSTYGDCVKTVLPTGAIRRLYDRYELVPEREEEFRALYETGNSVPLMLWDFLKEHKGFRRDRLLRENGEAWENWAERLVKKGFLTKKTFLSDSENRAYTDYYTCVVPADELRMLADGNPVIRKKYGFRRRSPVYPLILRILSELDGAETAYPELVDRCASEYCREAAMEPVKVLENALRSAPTGDFDEAIEETEERTLYSSANSPLTRETSENEVTAALKALVTMKFFSVRREDAYRNPYEAAADAAPPDENILNDEQAAAYRTLSALYMTHTPRAALLYGVTGSGKTRVIKALMDRVIADGRQVIMLVPEISLTPQSVAIFCAYYGKRVAVVHSGLSAGERLDVWRRAKNGDVDLVIGTRSAVFAPFERLGMIVIDEEQEHTYKSDQSPHYHARDAARYRCAKQNALMLLASATPSFESYYKAKSGVYTLVTLKNRYGGASLPEVIFADLHNDNAVGEVPLGNVLSDALEENKRRGEQSIFFINRRGYQKYVQCLSCKAPVECPHCSVPMVLHTRPDDRRVRVMEDYIDGQLICHYCGEHLAPPARCPSCGQPHLRAFGYGTQRAEAELYDRFAELRVLRMDADSTSGKLAHDEILSAFREKKADVLLGTQMVTKGHDFPDVTLVGILNADALLFCDDYRASERAFSLITQVIGRAGRGGKRGRAVIQTYDPENEILRAAATQNYDAFFESAIALRRALVFPPFCDMVLFSFSGENAGEVGMLADRAAQLLLLHIDPEKGDYPDVPLVVFGPFEAQVFRVGERYRMRVILKCKLNRRSRALLAEVLSAVTGSESVAVTLDCNPNNL